jgi:5-formyltetrahydrofolate cyclo-ligase
MRQTTTKPANKSREIRRRDLRSSRLDLSTSVRAAHDQAIRQHLRQLIDAQQLNSIAGYWSFDGEPDLAMLYQDLIADGCELALPVISGNNDFTMEFRAWDADTILASNWYGIPEPQNTTSIALSGFDMLILPLVAYDRHGNRLGVGAGYYDRHLESLRDQRSPLRVGVAYSLQELESIDKNDWDIPLHGIVNEHGWFTFT